MKLKQLTIILTIAAMTTFAASSKSTATGKKIRGGEVLKAYFEGGRKVKLVNVNGEYNYLSPKPRKKFLHLVVKLQKGYTISTKDYILKSGAAGFRASSIVKYGKDYIRGNEVVKASDKDTTYKMLFEVPASSTTFDLEFKLKTSIEQPVVKNIKVAAK